MTRKKPFRFLLLSAVICVFFALKSAVSFNLFAQSASSSSSSRSSSAKRATRSSIQIPDSADFWSDYPNEALADFLVSKMSNEELLSQILMFGWAGEQPSELLSQWVSDRGLGSVKVFGWNTDNTEQVAKSVSSLQQMAQNRNLKIPLFVATDQEGGWIRHVKGDTTETPGNMAIGASSYPSDAYYSGYYIAREIKALGINMNFAPTVDLYSNLQSVVIGPRSFGSDPDSVGVLGASFAAGSLAAGVIPTAKHFPGHGGTNADSHGRLPQIDVDYATLDSNDLVPFKYLIASKIPAIMSGHLSFPKIIQNGEPASLSKTFLTDILRKKLGFEGLIITDDMMMNGATLYAGSLSKAVRLAIEAGNDIIISSTTAHLQEALWTVNLDLMESESDFRSTVKRSARRVILAKLSYFKSENSAPLFPDVATLKDKIPDAEGQRFFLSLACRSITVYKQGAFPLTNEEAGRVLLAGQIQFPEFFSEAKKRYTNCGEFKYDYEMGPIQADWMSNNIETLIPSYDTIIICVANERNALIAERLASSGKRVIIMSVLSPVPVLDYSWADTILLGYSYSPFTFAAMFAALNGEYEAQGSLPLEISPR